MEDHTLEVFKWRAWLTTLHSIVICAVCHEAVNAKMVQCVNGHVICADCKNDRVKVCPSCMQRFSQVKPLIISQIIETFPVTCQYAECEVKVFVGDDHEQFCGWKPTKCRLCMWSGPGKDLVVHIQKNHQHKTIEDENSSQIPRPSAWPTNIPVLYFGHFFWKIVNLSDESVTIKYHPVPNGNSKANIFVEAQFKCTKGKCTFSIKLSLDCESEVKGENVITVPLNILSGSGKTEEGSERKFVITSTPL